MKTILWMCVVVCVVWAIALYTVVAQTVPNNEAQAIGQKLIQEINAGIQCNTALLGANQQLAAVQAEVKRLKDKYEPEEKK